MLSLYMSVTGRAAGQRFGPGSRWRWHFSEPWIPTGPVNACEVVLTGACTMTWWKDTWPKLRKELVISGSMDELCWTRMLIHCQSRFSWMSLMESSGTGFVYPWAVVVLHISLHLCFGQYIDGPVRGESRSLSPQNWCFEISWKLTYGWFGFSPLHTYACSTKKNFHHIDTMQQPKTWRRPWRVRNRIGSIESFTSARSWWNRRRNCESCSTKSIWTLGQLGQLGNRAILWVDWWDVQPVARDCIQWCGYD